MTQHWTFSPHSGGVKLTDSRKLEVTQRVEAYANRKLKGKCDRLVVRYRGVLCYVEAEQLQPDGRVFVFPLCRLRHFDLERWSIALYLFSSERYEPNLYPTGQWMGTLDEALDLASSFLPE